MSNKSDISEVVASMMRGFVNEENLNSFFESNSLSHPSEQQNFNQENNYSMVHPNEDISPEKATESTNIYAQTEEPAQRKLEHPILFEPMIFFDKPETEMDAEKEQQLHSEFESTKVSDDFNYTDSKQEISASHPTSTSKAPYKNMLNSNVIPYNKPNLGDNMGEHKSHQIKPFTAMNIFLRKVSIVVIKNKIYVYNGSCYTLASDNQVKKLIVDLCREIVENNGSPKFVDQIVDALKMEPKIEVSEDEVPKNLLSFKNCILDTDAIQTFPHSNNHLTLHCINGNYTHHCQNHSPIFDRFLYMVTGGDRDLMERIMQVIGYILSPDMSGKVFFLFQGVPNSGKSVLSSFIQQLFDENVVLSLDAHNFAEKFSTSELEGKMLCISPDMPAAPLKSETVSKIKQLTGNDLITSNRKFLNHIKFRCKAKLVLVTNHPLLTKIEDEAFNCRIVTVPFAYSIPKENQCPTLLNDLLAERDAIITKAIYAYFRLRENHYKFAGYYEPNKVTMGHSDSDAKDDINVYNFVESNFVKADSSSFVFTDDAYQKFSQIYGEISINVFSALFKRYAEEIFGAVKKRHKKPGNKNSISSLENIAWRMDFV